MTGSAGSQSATLFYRHRHPDFLIERHFLFSFFFFVVREIARRRKGEEIRMVNVTKAIYIHAPVALQDVKNDGVPLDSPTKDIVY